MPKKIAQIFHFDSFGKRQEKYDKLNETNVSAIEWKELEIKEPYYFFVPKDFGVKEKYDEGFLVSEIFNLNSSGITTSRDDFVIDEDKNNLENKLKDFIQLSKEDLFSKYNLRDNVSVKIDTAKQKIIFDLSLFAKITYKIFDERHILYSDLLLHRSRRKCMGNMLFENVGLIFMRQFVEDNGFNHVFVSKNIVDNRTFSSSRGTTYFFPLYLYNSDSQTSLENQQEKTPNFNMETIVKIEKKLGMKMTPLNLPKGETGRSEFDKPGYVTADSYAYKFIKESRDDLKDHMTEAEEIIWEELKTKKLGDKFRRQHIIDTFIVDFVCLDKKLIIEIDGKIHEQQKEKDYFRTKRLNELGFHVVRFKNEEVFSSLTQVIDTIKSELDKTPPLGAGGSFTPEDLFDYMYAVLHSQTYRETYKEFLKIDFPKIHFDVKKEDFFKLVQLGRELRSYHLMENENLIPKNFITKYEIDGDNLVQKVKYENESVFINDTQYFSGVPKEVWEFYIGGYQPAQKWLKDRKERNLGYEDILHYSKIILCLQNTIRIMKEIEKT